jgi:ribosomal protein S27E
MTNRKMCLSSIRPPGREKTLVLRACLARPCPHPEKVAAMANPFVRVRCPDCDATLRFPASAAGRTGECPKCGVRMTLPSDHGTLSPATSVDTDPASGIDSRKLRNAILIVAGLFLVLYLVVGHEPSPKDLYDATHKTYHQLPPTEPAAVRGTFDRPVRGQPEPAVEPSGHGFRLNRPSAVPSRPPAYAPLNPYPPARQPPSAITPRPSVPRPSVPRPPIRFR